MRVGRLLGLAWCLLLVALAAAPAAAQWNPFVALNNPVGVETDRAGRVYVHADAVFTTTLNRFATTGALTGQATIGGLEVGNLGRIVRIPGSDSMLLMTPRGRVLSFGPNLQAAPFLDLSALNFVTARAVFDVATRRFRPLFLGVPTWGDIAVYRPRPALLRIFATGNTSASGGFSFVIRVDVDLARNRVRWRGVLTSAGTTAGTVNLPPGVAVNRQGWVLTTMAFRIPAGFSDTLVAFRVPFPEVNSLRTVPRYVLRTNRTRTGLFDLPSFGMGTDVLGNFYVASGPVGSSLCGFTASAALVLVNRNPTIPLPRCVNLPAILSRSKDVTVSPLGNVPLMTVDNVVVSHRPLVAIAGAVGVSTPAAAPLDPARLRAVAGIPLEQMAGPGPL